MKLKYEYVTDKRTLRDVINALSSSNILYIDTETTEKEIRLIQIGNDEDIFVIGYYGGKPAFEKGKAFPCLSCLQLSRH